MKKCLDCGNYKSLEDFYSSIRKGKRKYQSYCKPCANSRRYASQKALKRKMFEHLGGKCSHCGIKEPLCIFDFHHTDKEKKDFTLNQKKSLSFDKIKNELDKCILLCANCHRIEHSK